MDRRTFVGLTAATTASSLLSITAFAQTAPKAKNIVLVASHVSLISQPETIADLILEAAG